MSTKKRGIIKYARGSGYAQAEKLRTTFNSTDDRVEYAKALASVRHDSSPNPTDDVALMRLWQSVLIKIGRDLDLELDGFTAEVIRCGDSWRDSKKTIKTLLEALIESHAAVKDFGQEVEDYILYITTHPGIRDEMAAAPTLILSEIHGTYSRAYDLCLQKLNAIHNDRRTVTNILLSVLAVIVALLSLYVAVYNPAAPPPQ